MDNMPIIMIVNTCGQVMVVGKGVNKKRGKKRGIKVSAVSTHDGQFRCTHYNTNGSFLSFFVW